MKNILPSSSSSPLFLDLPIPETLRSAIQALGFVSPTPIQAQAIPIALEGKDLIGLAQTGTGKTAAFGIPLVSRLIADREATALILVPTRELANQVCEVLKGLTQKNPELRVLSLIGGISIQGQLRQVSKSFRILVATPGRLIDHLEKRPDLLSRTAVVVLDEADRMLDMGFAPQLRRIFPRIPVKRQMILFSATFPSEIETMARQILKNPTKVQVGMVSVPVKQIHQRALRINGELKNDRLLDEINARPGSILVFVRTKRRTDRVAKFLKSYGVEVGSLHGGKTQGQRNQAIQKFKEEETRVLCATDIVARGLDISHVAHVINYDLPQVPEDYVHRIGRTARAGRAGESISFIASEEIELWRGIEKLLKQKDVVPTLEIATQGSSVVAPKVAPKAEPNTAPRNAPKTASNPPAKGSPQTTPKTPRQPRFKKQAFSQRFLRG